MIEYKDYSSRDHLGSSIIDFDIENVKSATGFIPAYCRVIAGIANYDGLLTIEEYSLLVEMANSITNDINEKAQINAIIIDSLQGRSNFDALCRDLKKHSLDIEKSILDQLYKATTPLLVCQHKDSAEIEERLADALGVENSKKPKKNFGMLPSLKAGIIALRNNTKNITSISIKNDENQKIFAARHLAFLFERSNFIELTESTLNEDDINDLIRSEWIESRNYILNELNSKIISKEILIDNNDYKKIENLADMLIEQVLSRLVFIGKRLELQREMFRSDVERFIEESVDQVELDLRSRMETTDWTNPEVWRDFSSRQVSVRIDSQYKALIDKYRKANEIWNEELQDFGDQIGKNREVLNGVLSASDFATLTPPLSKSAQVFRNIDKAVNVVFSSAAVGAVFAGVAVGTKAVSLGAVAGFMLTNPVGWTIAGTVGVAAAYDLFSDPSLRFQKEIRQKRDAIRKGLLAMIGDPIADHDKQMYEFKNKFHAIAQQNLQPIVTNIELTKYIRKNESEIIRRSTDQLIKIVDQIDL